MKLKIILFLICLISCTVYSQTYNGVVAYDHIINNNSINHQKEYILQFDENSSIYVETLDSLESKEGTDLTVEENYGTYEVKYGNDNKYQYYYYSSIDKNIYFRERVIDESILVKEDKNIYNWKIVDSTKIISGYQAQMATTDFRGRKYVAWFTREIPIPYGPWKFNNLPGLILEVSDSTGFFYAMAKNIQIGKGNQLILNKIQKEIIKEDNYVSLEKYIDFKEAKNQAMLEKINSRLPKGMKPFKLDKDCEDCGDHLEIFNE